MFTRRSLKFIIRAVRRESCLLDNVSSVVRTRTISATTKLQKTDDGNSLGYKTTSYANKIVFVSKETPELLRALFTLTSSSVDTFVTYSDKILLTTRKFLWKPLFDAIMKKTFYGQFAAGECMETSKETVNKLKKSGIRTMMMVPIEALEYNTQEEEDEILQKNFHLVQQCIYDEAALENNGFSQLKLTALCNKDLVMEMNKHLVEYEKDHKEPGVWDIKTMSRCLEDGRYQDINIPELGTGMNKKLQTLFKRINDLAQLCKEKNVRMMIDAEQTYLQAALGYLILVLQAKFNKEEPIVYNTYQCFRKDTLDRLTADYHLSVDVGFKIACKLVRGAYLIEERKLASEKGYDDPINDNFDDTTRMYHSCVDFFLPMINRGDAGVMVASHNENTVDFVLDRMTTHDISKASNYLCFGQIYGMCDHVTYYLAEEGYKPFKSVPYGPIGDTILYLTRRAQENRSVMERTTLERQMIRQELKRRVGNIFSRMK